jgi:amino acid transporter
MSEEHQEDSVSLTKLLRKMDELRVTMQIIVILILFICIIQFIQMMMDPLSPLHPWSFYIIIVEVSLILLVIIFLPTKNPPQSTEYKRRTGAYTGT